MLTTNLGFMNIELAASNASRLGGAGFDGGSCCANTWLMNQLVGSPGVAGALPTYNAADTVKTGTTIINSGSGTVAPQMTKISCVAAASLALDDTATTGSWGAMTWDVTTTAWSSWWCSNGLYKQVTSNVTAGFKGNFNQ